ncbi:MAG: hypothetical protein IT424_03940 [Pirellulales bacterium]|nr:hypothetical protein [Pirellulales bacterium]
MQINRPKRPNCQLPLPLADAKETQVERLRRILAGVPKVTTAAVYFTEQAYREATARAEAEACARRQAPGVVAI